MEIQTAPLPNLKAACALHLAHYNFCRVHSSLRVTPAMAAGLANEVWPPSCVALLTPAKEFKSMNEISSSVAFWILDTWRRMEAQLQVDALDGRRVTQGSPAVILRTSPNEESVSMVAVDNKGQNLEWTVSLKKCKFGFGVASESPFPELTEGVFISVLAVDMPGNKHLIFRQRFVDTEMPPR